MAEWIDAQVRYLKQAERRARAAGLSVSEYLAKHTTLHEQAEDAPIAPAAPAQPKPAAVERMAQPIRAAPPIPAKQELPMYDAIIEFRVREPRGEFQFELAIPNIGEIFVANLRNERGYKQAFIDAILYKFYGQIA